jgi:hypothetical protein
MVTKVNNWKTPSRSSPKGGQRGCVCADNTYNKKCCDGSIIAQGIGRIQRIPQFILLESGSYLLQENNSKLSQ